MAQNLQTTKSNPVELQTVEFNGDNLVTFQVGGEPHVAMRPIVENLGLSWASQTVKLNDQRAKFNCCDIETVGADGKQRSMLAIPTKRLTLWLASINPNKIKNAAKRQKIELYQEECAEALYSYWHTGIAVRGDMDGIVTELDPKVMQAIGGMFKGIVQKALTEYVPKMIDMQLADREIGIVRGVTAYDVGTMAGVKDRKGLRGLGCFVSRRLRQYHARNGVAVKMRETYGSVGGVYIYDKNAARDWLNSGGKSAIEEYVARKRGRPGQLALVQS